MDTHTLSAGDLLPSDAQSHDTGDLDHEPAPKRPTHPPSQLPEGHAEKEGEAASLPLGANLEQETAEPLSLPGEHEAESGDHSSPAAPTAPRAVAKTSPRNLLLGTALALTMMVGGGGFYILSHRGPAFQLAATPPPAWHSEQVARNPADPVGVLAANPFPPSPKNVEQASRGADDILALHHESTIQPTAAAVLPPVPMPAARTVPPAATVPAAPPPPAVVAAPAHSDAVATALALRPAPMTPAQQVDVLSLVTQLAALVRDMRTENAQLRDRVAALDDTVKNETSDVGQRLNLMEARKAIASAQDAGKPQPPAVVAVTTGPASAPARVVQTVAVVPVPVAIRSVRDYRVQAASPGLAILADANAPPGQSAGLQVAVGDQVPGIGRITSIGQRGTAWVVQTNHGTIQ